MTRKGGARAGGGMAARPVAWVGGAFAQGPDSAASERARVMAEARCEAEVIRAAVDRALAEAEAARDSALALQAAARAELAEARSEAEVSDSPILFRAQYHARGHSACSPRNARARATAPRPGHSPARCPAPCANPAALSRRPTLRAARPRARRILLVSRQIAFCLPPPSALLRAPLRAASAGPQHERIP